MSCDSQHTPGLPPRLPCSPFAPVARSSPRGDDAAGGFRSGGAGDVSDLAVVEDKLVAAEGEGGEVVGEAQSAEGLRDLAVGADARDGFLADVATLRVADGAGFDAGFGGEVGFVDVETEAGDAGFEAGEFEGFRSGEAAGFLAGGGDELVENHGLDVEGDEEVEADGAGTGIPGDVEFPEGGVREVGDGEVGLAVVLDGLGLRRDLARDGLVLRDQLALLVHLGGVGVDLLFGRLLMVQLP
jgi:hypothetical protein